MSPAHVRKVAGTEPPHPVQAHTDAAPAGTPTAVVPSPAPPVPHATAGPVTSPLAARDAPDRARAVQDRLATWVCDLSLLHELTERLARTAVLDDALHEVLRAGATLVGARRGLIALEPADGLGPDSSVGLGLGRCDLGALETVPHHALYASPRDAHRSGDCVASCDGTCADACAGSRDGDAGGEVVHPDLLHEPGLLPRHREVARQLGLGASYAVPLTAEATGRLGTAVWFYDEAAEPAESRRRLAALYLRHAGEHLGRCLALSRAEHVADALAEELLPARLPRVPGVRLAVRHTAGPRGGGDWYDALPLPEGALGLAVGGVTGAGPGAVAAMGRLRASLRAYAVMEGEDPVAVLSDLELLLRLTEPARSATALFAYAAASDGTPAGGGRKLTMAGAGHCPPLVVGDLRCEYVETSLSAPLNVLSCWEAPSVELTVRAGESLLLFTDGLLHRTGDPADRAFARLHAAAQGASRAMRADPELLADHVLRTLLPDGLDTADGVEDLVLLVARFD
ncbi:Serine phosphatase RsbU, regulator of sigma subunit [Actinacidiphila rubida]|uniref:Serine phosphatase RsbU, regulator of sigma subunit n=1 Tax=Actinacidiphila rubida TaxID=310780 RepID=A0A1H8GBP3_9ACTN|nr:PP2C family protein-serine/threonine phosphatase [Actinacidiphila rubida]SEN41422.1 Serine phosphatase RsbU, regulator of sigma subunit [Actinacidiphila rubida]